MNRQFLGQPKTVGELRDMLNRFVDKAPLMVRNGPLPSLYYVQAESKEGGSAIEFGEVPELAWQLTPIVAKPGSMVTLHHFKGRDNDGRDRYSISISQPAKERYYAQHWNVVQLIAGSVAKVAGQWRRAV